jgi:hypothetical protein
MASILNFIIKFETEPKRISASSVIAFAFIEASRVTSTVYCVFNSFFSSTSHVMNL